MSPTLSRMHLRWAAAATAVGLVLGISACTTFDNLAVGTTANVVNPNGKVAGASCATGDDCQSGTCTSGSCTAVVSANATNGKKDGSETDVDCGGGAAPTCADGQACKSATDCTNGVCTSNTCASPSPTDGIKNGDETDVDCGGTKAPKCAADKACAADGDCASDTCSYAKKCLADHAKSCAQHFGGDTCGEGDTGAADAKHESCCATVKNNDGLTIGKYQITAGRMRAFATKFGGNLRSWAATNPPTWDSSFTDRLPSSMSEVNGTLGPLTKRGCSVPANGGRTWYQDIGGGEQSDFSKDVLDEKALNCVPWYMAAALCAYDGGRLPTNDEIQSFITNDGATQWPWGGSFANAAKATDPHLVHFYSYNTPNAEVGNDRSFYIAPPGRRPSGNNQLGVADALGNLLQWTSDGYNIFAWTVSFEEHTWQRATGDWSRSANSSEIDGYYGIGGRCVFDN